MENIETNPFFTIIVPTKARPDLIDYVLFTLHNQTFRDFSVVISDDYDDMSCEEVVRKYHDDRFKYVVPPKELELGMCGNWEYGLNFADGQYIIFLQDKMFLYENSLEYLESFIKEHKNPDIVSWSWDFFAFDDDNDRKSGVLSQKRKTGKYKKWDIIELVKEKLSFDNFTYQNKTGAPGAASPLCSAVRHSLYNEIKEEYGLVFDFINPDYGPPIRLLDFASDVYELEDNLTVLMPVSKSEGVIHAKSYTAALRFLEKSPGGIKRMRYAVIPELISTDSNMVSADYNYSIEKSKQFKCLGRCNILNALCSIAKDLKQIEYPSKEKEVSESEAFLRVFKSLSTEEQQIISNVTTPNMGLISAIKYVYHKIIPLRIRLFKGQVINRFRDLEYHKKWFNEPTKAFNKLL